MVLSRIVVLGVGPGGSAWVTPAVKEQVKKCQVLCGGRRNLQLFPSFSGEKREITGELSSLVGDLKKELTKEKQIGVLVSGDPGMYSLMGYLQKHFPGELLEIVPGISALQYFFARLKLTWQDARVISLHGREAGEVVDYFRQFPKVGLFTDTINTPGEICRLMVEKNLAEKTVYIGENLSYPEEKITSGTPRELSRVECNELNVMVVLNNDL